jgi:hypothetical protein
LDLNIFERNNNNSNGFIKEFIRDLKNALKNMMDEGKGMNENDKVLEEYNLYERRKIFLDNKSWKGNGYAWVMDENSVCISENGDGGPCSIFEIDLPKNAKVGEVYENGDIANWKIPGKMVKGMGGAMDLVASAKNIIVAMQQVNKHGESKLLPECTLPLTGVKCIKKIVTELGVYEVKDGAFHCLERAPGVSVDDIKKATAGKLIIDDNVPEMVF